MLTLMSRRTLRAPLTPWSLLPLFLLFRCLMFWGAMMGTSEEISAMEEHLRQMQELTQAQTERLKMADQDLRKLDRLVKPKKKLLRRLRKLDH